MEVKLHTFSDLQGNSREVECFLLVYIPVSIFFVNLYLLILHTKIKKSFDLIETDVGVRMFSAVST
jgi:hypothetical protein